MESLYANKTGFSARRSPEGGNCLDGFLQLDPFIYLLSKRPKAETREYASDLERVVATGEDDKKI